MYTKYKIFALMLAIGITGASLIGCGGSSSQSDSGSGGTTDAAAESTDAVTEGTDAAELGFDTPFEFDDLTITFGSSIGTEMLQNQFSEHDGKTVIAIPVSITNNSGTTHGLNMFYYKVFNPDGTQSDSISSYFSESDIDFAGDVRSGGTLQSTFHILYAGDGDYYIEFEKPFDADKIEVKLPIVVGDQ